MRVIFFFIILYSTPLFASQNKIIRCVTTHYPPFTIYDTNTETFTGLDIEYLRFIEHNLELNIELVHLPWARVQKEMKKDNFDCYFSLGNNPERAKYLDFTTVPLHVTKFGLFTINDQNVINNNLSQAAISMLRGVDLPVEIAKKYAIDSNNIMRSLSSEDTFKLLKKGRVQYAITNYQAGLWYTQPFKNITSIELNEFQLPVYIAFKFGVIDTHKVDQQIKAFQAKRLNKNDD
ncbi:substrate-binding periplasmic protein [Pseudoalteromonas fuliginea]|uniref:substrate-binding periplasmic protein n=1 Tax=Pseudoalteromonas fuliginea TaxID=1872678 RepID=UPI003171F9B6